MSNPLHEVRLHYPPKLPQLFQQLNRVELLSGEKKSVDPTIVELFPRTADQPLLQFRIGVSKTYQPFRVGVVLSGGQAPGGHNVIIGLFDALKKMNPESQLFGFLGGPSGILENRHRELTAEIIAPYRNTGGFDLIGSGRTKIETPEQLQAAEQTCSQLNLDGLVVIGGDDSNTNAAILAEYFLKQGCQVRLIGVPKTIDGDLKNELIECSFGFDTASKIYSEMIGNLCLDALSAKKYTHFIKLMGRSASHIALECALQTHPNVTLIGEEIAEKRWTLHQIVDHLCEIIARRAEQGKQFGIILIPEGLIEFIPEMNLLFKELNSLLAEEEKNDVVQRLSPPAADAFASLPQEIGQQLLFDRDPHGNVQVSHIATEQILISLVQQRLKKWPGYRGKFHPLGHFFGYEGRCGYPSNFDANYCYALGHVAALLIGSGKTGYISALQKLSDSPDKWLPLGIPLVSLIHIEERKGKKKPVIQKALVDLHGEPFRFFARHRTAWATDDLYRNPGPIQFEGPAFLSDATTLTLKLEQRLHLSL